jgi:hypothetical protein
MRRLPDLRRFLEAMMAATRVETEALESLFSIFFLFALFLFFIFASSPFAIATTETQRERKREAFALLQLRSAVLKLKELLLLLRIRPFVAQWHDRYLRNNCKGQRVISIIQRSSWTLGLGLFY